jgi:MFS family permease
LKSVAVWAGVAIGVTLLGWGIGGLVGGTLADYVGRKRIMILSVLAYALISGVTALSTTFLMFAAFRFATGFAMGSEWSTGVAMLAETWPDRARPKGAGFLQSGFGWGTLR